MLQLKSMLNIVKLILIYIISSSSFEIKFTVSSPLIAMNLDTNKTQI